MDTRLERVKQLTRELNGGTDPETVTFRVGGFDCAAALGPCSHWCGYLAVPKGHPWHGKDYDRCETANGGYVDVHGGLTYSAERYPGGKPDGQWWIGFDCAHVGDLVPALAVDNPHKMPGDTYKDVSFIKRECQRLAEQASKVAERGTPLPEPPEPDQ